MDEFILGIPKKKEQTAVNITRYTNQQDAGYACVNFVGVFSENQDKAKEKFMEIAERNFEPQNKHQ